MFRKAGESISVGQGIESFLLNRNGGVRMRGPRALFLSAAVAVTVITIGCAFSANPVQIRYSSPQDALNAGSPVQTVIIGEVKDARGMEDPKMLVHKQNLNGQTTSGGYVAEKPIAEILRDALRSVFEQTSHSGLVGAASSYTMSAELMDFTYNSVSKWSTVRLNSKMEVRVILRDNSSHKIVWEETFVGRGLVEKFSGSEDAVKQMFSKALDDFLVQLTSSETLKDKMAGKS